MRHPAIDMSGVSAGQSTLTGVQVQGTVNEVFTLVRATQTYRNLETTNIEAVYTFPMPVEATLLELEARIGGKTLAGAVFKREEAETRYEEAIIDGDSAILLENPSPGLYAVSLGNLMPGEEATLRFSYALLNAWSEDELRFFLPTTIAPRYGDPIGAGLREHQVPEFSIEDVNRVRISLELTGGLRDCAAESPTHGIETSRTVEATVVNVLGLRDGTVVMDRDFVLNIRAARPITSSVLVERSGDGIVAAGWFRPRFPETGQPGPRCVSIVLDCSGSMIGDSIAQARKALQAILPSLRRQDLFNVILFGNRARKLFENPVPAAPENIEKAARLAATLSANLGGTEIGLALETALATHAPSKAPHDILLVTDGEAWEDGSLARRLASAGRRVFAVGVGSAVTEAFLRELASSTGGACELVSPNEAMSKAIQAQFRRIFSDVGQDARVRWPANPEEEYPQKLPRVFEGDTFHVFARFTREITGPVELAFKAGCACVTESAQALPLPAMGLPRPGDTGLLARLMAAAMMKAPEISRETAEDLAVRHQLMSPWTNYLLVLERQDGEKAVDIPELRKVRQTLAAGWHGMGSVAEPIPMTSMDASLSLSTPRYSRRRRPSSGMRHDEMVCCSVDFRGDDSSRSPALAECRHFLLERVIDFCAAFNSAYGGDGILPPLSLEDLLALGAPEEIVALARSRHTDIPEEMLGVALLLCLVRPGPYSRLDRHSARLVVARAKGLPGVDALAAALAPRLELLIFRAEEEPDILPAL